MSFGVGNTAQEKQVSFILIHQFSLGHVSPERPINKIFPTVNSGSYGVRITIDVYFKKTVLVWKEMASGYSAGHTRMRTQVQISSTALKCRCSDVCQWLTSQRWGSLDFTEQSVKPYQRVPCSNDSVSESKVESNRGKTQH